jgi:anti-sigma factor RsiW
MDCRKVRECLPDYLDGVLSPKTRDAVAAHLEGCAGCAAERRLSSATRQLLVTHAATRSPVDFTHLARNLAPAKRRWEIILWLQRGLVTTAAAAALFGITWQAQHSGLPTTPSPTRVALREVAEVDELHQEFAVDKSLHDRDGLVLFAAQWAERSR